MTSRRNHSMNSNILHDRARRRGALQSASRSRLGDGRLLFWIAVSAMLVLAVWSYWPTMIELFKEWRGDDDYSAGQLVPWVCLFFIWRQRNALRQCPLVPCWWGGIALLFLAQAGRSYGLLFMFESAERYAMVLTVAGLVLLVAGWRVVRRVSWILLFLFLMVPLPGRVHNLIGGPLQGLATSGSVFVLEAVLPRVSQQGNIVMLDENTPMAVAEACSGLRMLTAFVIVAGFIAYMIKRPRWQKTVLLVSSIPVAVACNIVRIFATALVMLTVSKEVGEAFFHDFAGVVMMPAAVLLMFGEIWLMDRLVLPDSEGSQGRKDSASKAGGGRAVVVVRKRTRTQ